MAMNEIGKAKTGAITFEIATQPLTNKSQPKSMPKGGWALWPSDSAPSSSAQPSSAKPTGVSAMQSAPAGKLTGDDIRKALKNDLDQIKRGRDAEKDARNPYNAKSLKDAQRTIFFGSANLKGSIENLVEANSRKMDAPFIDIPNLDDAAKIESSILKAYAADSSRDEVLWGILNEKEDQTFSFLHKLNDAIVKNNVKLNGGQAKAIIKYAADALMINIANMKAPHGTIERDTDTLKHFILDQRSIHIDKDVLVAVVKQCQQKGAKIPEGADKFVDTVLKSITSDK